MSAGLYIITLKDPRSWIEIMSWMDVLSVMNMVSLSIPIPMPDVGGIPYSKARKSPGR